MYCQFLPHQKPDRCTLHSQLQFWPPRDEFRNYLGSAKAISAVTAGGSLVAILESNIAVHDVQCNRTLQNHFSLFFKKWKQQPDRM